MKNEGLDAEQHNEHYYQDPFSDPSPPTSPASFYRIALLHIVVKFHEQVLRSLCLPFLTFHSPVSALQSVFCSVHCTETSCVKKICDAGASGSCSVANLPGLLAFDTVNNQALLLVSRPGHALSLSL